MEAHSDAELVRRARAGDQAAFGCLAERYGAMARRVAYSMVGHEELARELAQEALLRAYLYLDTLRAEARFASWLYGIVLNVCRGYHRSQRADFTSLEALEGGRRSGARPLVSPAPDPQQLVEARELQSLVLAAVNALSPANRAATLLFYYEQLSLREVAAALGISKGAVKGRLHKARQQLRAQLQTLSSNERRPGMVRVKVIDVVTLEQAEERTANIVVLLDEAGQRVLPIWVGPFEATAIALSLGEAATPRPLTYQFTANLLTASGVTLEEVRVQALKSEVFYAVAVIRQGDGVREVDARPSDAIALAQHMGSPLYVAEEILASEGYAVPQEGSATLPGKGIAEIRQKMEAEMNAHRARAPWTDEQREQSRRGILELVFGNGPSEEG